MPNSKFLYSLIAILVLLLAAAGYYLVKIPNPLKSQTFVDNKVVFAAAKVGSSGVLGLYSYASDGTVRELLTPGFSEALNATLSPDLKKIAFVATRDGGQVIAVLDMGGSEARQVSKLIGAKTMPSWSPDGSKILYALSAQNGGIAQIDLARDADTVVTLGTNMAQTPDWLPDGSGFVYTGLSLDQQAGRLSTHLVLYKNGASSEIKLMGDKNATLTDAGSPAVSPDGKSIVFVRSSDSRVYMAGIDGRNMRLLTTSGSSLFSCPSWSLDASFVLAAESDNSGKYYLSKINVGDGTVSRSGLSGYSKINCPRMARY